MQRIRFLQEKDKNDKLYLRVAVEGGGCSGFQYKYNMEQDELADDDKYAI